MRMLGGCSMVLGLACAAGCAGGNGEAKSAIANAGAGSGGAEPSAGAGAAPTIVGGGGVGGVGVGGANAIAGSASVNGGTSSGGSLANGGSGLVGPGMLPSATTCGTPWPANAPKLKTDDWTAINPPNAPFAGEPGNGAFAQGMAVDRCNPSTIYLGVNSFDISQGGLYKTVDAGAHWTRVSTLDEPVRVRVDPKDPNHVYVGDGVRGSTLGFWVSHDGGNSFLKPTGYTKLQGSVYNLDDIYDVAVDPADFNHVLLTYHSGWGTAANMSNSGVMESKNGGDDWIVHNPEPTWGAGLNVWFIDSPIKWLVGTQNDGYWRTTDSGGHWAHVSTTPMMHGGAQLYTTKAGVMYISSSSAILKSTDNGVTWNSVPSMVGPSTSVFGTGTTMFTHACYSLGSARFSAAAENNDQAWAPFGGSFTDGPFEMVYDDVNHILYSANWGNGLLALKVP